MESLNNAITVTISRQSQYPSLPSYNTVLIAAEFSAASVTPPFGSTERVRVLTGGSEAILSSITTMFGGTSVFYGMATAAFLQNPTIDTLYIGRKLTGGDGTETWTAALSAINLANNSWYGLITADRTLASQETISTWIETNGKTYWLDTADPNMPNGVGDIASYLQTQKYTREVPIYKATACWRDTVLFTFSGTFIASNVATFTVNGVAETAVTWDGTIITSNALMYGAIQTVLEAAFPDATVSINATTFTVELYQVGAQWDVAFSGTNNSCAVTLGASRPTCAVTYPNDAEETWFAVAELAYYFAVSTLETNVPGSVDACYTSLIGQTPDNLTPAQLNTICGSPINGSVGKNGNVYVEMAGINVFEYGFVGDGERIDVIIGLDYLSSLIQNKVFTQLINRVSQPKVPYTDPGIRQVAKAVEDALTDGVNGGIIINPAVIAPLASTISPATKETRSLAGISWTATLVGSVQTVPIAGIVTY